MCASFRQIFLIRNFIFSLLILVFSLKTRAQLPGTNPSEQGFNEPRMARIDQFIQEYINSQRLNGAAAIIVRNGNIVYHKAFGYSNKEKGTLMRTDHIFRIASMTKPIVSVAAMMLWEEGKFSLEDPVSKFIPEFDSARVLLKFNPKDSSYTSIPAKRAITIRHLLTHTSGIGYAQIGSAAANAIYAKNDINGGIGTPMRTLKQVIPRLARLPLFHQPGEKFLYGMNTDVLGYLIEVISGMALDVFLEQRIFHPMGMKNTFFYLPQSKKDLLVPLYKYEDKSGLTPYSKNLSIGGDADFPISPGGSYFSGGAGLCSTTFDYAIFCQMLINGGTLNGKRYLSPYTIQMMTTNQIGDYSMWGEENEPKRFGLGFGLYPVKSKHLFPVGEGTYDWAGIFASHFWVDPNNKLVAIFMRNIWPTPDWDFGDRVKQVVYQALEK